MECSENWSKREAYNNTILSQNTGKTSNRQPNFTPKISGKEEKIKIKNKISKRKAIKKIRAEISEKKCKKK